MDERTMTDAHGVAVFTRWWPVEEPAGVVLISHGASEHSGRYDRFASALNAAGFAAAALDHRGHGRTVPAPGPATMGPGGGQAVIDDLHELRAAAAVEFGPDVPVLLFAHSMGSLIGLGYLTAHSAGLAGAVLCGFAADLAQSDDLATFLRAAADDAGRDTPAAILAANNAAFEPARTPYDWLSRDPDEVDRYIADPMSGDDNPLTYGYLVDLFDALTPSRDRLGDVACPVLVIAGERDPAAAMGAHARGVAELLRAAGVPVDLTIYPDARHELLNETNRDEVTADVVAWLRRHADRHA